MRASATLRIVDSGPIILPGGANFLVAQKKRTPGGVLFHLVGTRVGTWRIQVYFFAFFLGTAKPAFLKALSLNTRAN